MNRDNILLREVEGQRYATTKEVYREELSVLNFAREGIIEASILKAGLDSGRIGRYVTDFPSADLIGGARVVGLPHLGASTGEAEENCAVMVVDQLREFLENGNVYNSVNFPNTRMARADYCGDGKSHTKAGTVIDYYDSAGVAARTVQASAGWVPDQASFEASWASDGASCLSRRCSAASRSRPAMLRFFPPCPARRTDHFYRSRAHARHEHQGSAFD